MSRIRVLSVTSDRADVGINAPVWTAMSKCTDFDLAVFVTGTHMEDDRASRVVPRKCRIFRGGAPLSGVSGFSSHESMVEISRSAAKIMENENFQLLMVSGDRLDLFPVVTASLAFNIPVAHIAGGDLTFGAIDERLRHAITKLAHLHYVTTPGAAQRLASMGEEDWRIHHVGAPNLDALLNARNVSNDEFMEVVGGAFAHNFRLVTVHSETNAADPLGAAKAVLSGLKTDRRQVLVTAPNLDPGGKELRSMIECWARESPHVCYVPNLGTDYYASALQRADVMIGNSSSGIIEAGLFGLPVVNVGNRQEGRERGVNVIDTNADASDVLSAVLRAESLGRFSTDTTYGDGKASSRIVSSIRDLMARKDLLHKKFVHGSISLGV